MDNKAIDTTEPIHDFFGLSYASYLVLPRSALQSAPKEWQAKFVKLVEELVEMFDDSIQEPSSYQVYLRSINTGKYIHDPLQDYERGRRRIPIKIK